MTTGILIHSKSLFDVNLLKFFEQEGKEETLKRCQWGYQRLSPEHKQRVKEFIYDSDEVYELVRTLFQSLNHNQKHHPLFSTLIINNFPSILRDV